MQSLYLQLQSKHSLFSCCPNLEVLLTRLFPIAPKPSLHAYVSASGQAWNRPLKQLDTWCPVTVPIIGMPEHSPRKHPESPGSANLTVCTKSSTNQQDWLLSLQSFWVDLPPICSIRAQLSKISSQKESNTSSTLHPSSGDPHIPALHPNLWEN